MANRTVKDKIIRTRIYESKYWKEECFGLTAELVVDKAMDLRFVGGVYGGTSSPRRSASPLKMLQIRRKDIIVEYVRCWGPPYMRLTGTLLHAERVCDVILPRTKRQVLEEAELLEPRVSALGRPGRGGDDHVVSRPRSTGGTSPDTEPHRRGYRDNDRPPPPPVPVPLPRYRRSRSPRRRSRSPEQESTAPPQQNLLRTIASVEPRS
uniref:Pre-mRNA-splicing factor 38B n=1 Tax=Salarias fasciatus TaxID=181472 RepID=A0A672HPG9_SALFA